MTEIVDPKSSDRRRDWGLILLAGGGMAMTAFAGWLAYSFMYGPWPDDTAATRLGWLGWALIGCLGLVGVVLTGFSGLLVKRTLRLGKDGFQSEDKGDA